MLMIRFKLKFRFVPSVLMAFAIPFFVQIAANQTTYGAIFQDNPFEVTRSDDSTSGDSEGSATKEAQTPEAVFELTADNARSNVGLVVRSIRRQDPQTAAELAQAISLLIDVEAWTDARVYLNQLSKVVMNDKELYDLYTDRGAEFFYILHSVEQSFG